MLLNIILIIFTFLGFGIFLLTPQQFWVIGIGLIFVMWVIYLRWVIPYKRPQTRGLWAVMACFVLLAATVSMAILIYLQSYQITVLLTNESLNSIPYLGARAYALIIGLAASLVITFLFFGAVGYFSSIYILALPVEEDLSFWNAFRSFISLIFNIQRDWLLIKDGEATSIKEKGFWNDGFGLGKIVIRPENAVILEKGGKIVKICGAGVEVVGKEKIRQIFDLRPHTHVERLENVITADRIPLTLEVGISYSIRPAANPDASGVIKEKNFGIYPVDPETLRQAAFNLRDWHLFAQGATKNNLRDQFMAHTIEELFRVPTGAADIRVNNRQIRAIEMAVQTNINNIALNNGVEISGVDIRQITLPDEIREAIQLRIRSQAEADGIRNIESERNIARSELFTRILSSIASRPNNVTNLELQLATTFAHITRRALTDDVLGHQYVEMLKALAEGKGTNIFNATPGSTPIEPGFVLPDMYSPQNGQTPRNGHN